MLLYISLYSRQRAITMCTYLHVLHLYKFYNLLVAFRLLSNFILCHSIGQRAFRHFKDTESIAKYQKRSWIDKQKEGASHFYSYHTNASPNLPNCAGNWWYGNTGSNAKLPGRATCHEWVRRDDYQSGKTAWQVISGTEVFSFISGISGFYEKIRTFLEIRFLIPRVFISYIMLSVNIRLRYTTLKGLDLWKKKYD